MTMRPFEKVCALDSDLLGIWDTFQASARQGKKSKMLVQELEPVEAGLGVERMAAVVELDLFRP
jgi:hypothetical protein